MSNAVFETRTSRFLHWFQSHCKDFNPKIQLADLRHQDEGRGLIALQDIEADETLFTVSRNDILSVESSDFANDPKAQQLLEHVEGLDNPWLPLILVMIGERLRVSRWAPYLDVLPISFDTLMFWSDEELAWLEASAVRDKIGKEVADETFRTSIVPAVRNNSSLFPSSDSMSDEDILRLAHHMGSLIMAYAFDIEPESSKQQADEDGYVSDEDYEMLPKGMVPMADMLNADAGRHNASLFYEESSVSMKAIVDIKAGEQIFNDYGELPRADLLRRYGYATDNYKEFDVVEIPRHVAVGTLAKRAQSGQLFRASIEDFEQINTVLELLEEEPANISVDHGFILNWPLEGEDLFPQDLRMLIAALDSPSAERESNFSPKAMLKKMTRTQLLSHFLPILETQLARYSSTIEADLEILEKLPATEKRQRMAFSVRSGEKQLLRAAMDKVRDELQSLEGASSGPQKRQALSDESDGHKKRRMD